MISTNQGGARACNSQEHRQSVICRIRSLLSGIRDTFAFSNWPLVVAQRIFCRNLAAVVYEWKGKWLVACDPRFGDHYGLKEVFVHADYDSFIHASIRGGSISYVNIGANVGAFDIAVASLAPGGSSGLSVELNPKTYARLLFNLSVNNLEGVRAINAAIGRRTGVVGFFPSKISLEDSIFGETTGGTHKVEVRMLTLEDLLNEDGDRSRTFDLL
jgi:FkbM family methyltransferase